MQGRKLGYLSSYVHAPLVEDACYRHELPSAVLSGRAVQVTGESTGMCGHCPECKDAFEGRGGVGESGRTPAASAKHIFVFEDTQVFNSSSLKVLKRNCHLNVK